MIDDILKKNYLARKIKRAIDDGQDLTLSYEELLQVYSSYLIGIASDTILDEILYERYRVGNIWVYGLMW